MATEPYTVSQGDPIRANWANAVVGKLKELDNVTPRLPLKGGGAGLALCPFGKITSHDNKTYILGGVLYAGDKNFNVSDKELTLTASGTWLSYIELDVEANRDEDHEILLPGIKTSTDTPEFKVKVWTEGTNYDPNTNPDVTTGIGTIRIPLGKLIIKDGVATLQPAACGNIRVEQCAGILSHTRE